MRHCPDRLAVKLGAPAGRGTAVFMDLKGGALNRGNLNRRIEVAANSKRKVSTVRENMAFHRL